ncbi:uncharacterized protein LOC109504449 [Harpegnathos saltator]|uniref:uncharacterized protein LOC109504449 n=1 Tax=Harpegnathos saltator TaxID=610380 RepID=UPI000948B897|nr:uncharacterized protein LOC109504449 [Harpegnathos saltator]
MKYSLCLQRRPRQGRALLRLLVSSLMIHCERKAEIHESNGGGGGGGGDRGCKFDSSTLWMHARVREKTSRRLGREKPSSRRNRSPPSNWYRFPETGKESGRFTKTPFRHFRLSAYWRRPRRRLTILRYAKSNTSERASSRTHERGRRFFHKTSPSTRMLNRVSGSMTRLQIPAGVCILHDLRAPATAAVVCGM